MENKTEEQEETAKDDAKEQSPEPEKTRSEADQLAELNDKYLRLYSEFDNYKKRSQKERQDVFKFAGEEILTGILPVLDDFERALKAEANSLDKALSDGLVLIHNKLLNILKQRGVEEIKTENETFNTDVHEAITNIPAPSEEMKGKVIECVEKGYYLHGKVIRFAKVVVGS